MEHQRAHRVGELIHQEISSLLLKGLKDPRIGFVTITNVTVTPDLHLARVYFTAMGDEKERTNTEKGLQSAVPYLRRELGKRLRMRYVPDLVFHFDSSLEYGNRIESLLREIHQEDNRDPGDTENH
ncbi:MAG: ribosome-binding factor A [Syntrophotaleaceae bacterium]